MGVRRMVRRRILDGSTMLGCLWTLLHEQSLKGCWGFWGLVGSQERDLGSELQIMHDFVRSELLVHGQVGPVAIYQGFQFSVVDYRWRVRRQASGREGFPEFRRGWVFIGIEGWDIRAFLFRLFVLRRRREGYSFRRRQPCFYSLPVERSADPDSAETWSIYLFSTYCKVSMC